MAVVVEGGPQGMYRNFDLQRTRTNYIMFHIDKTSESPDVCVGCAERRD